MGKKRGAIIVGEEHYNTLGMLRSLGEAGIVCSFINTGKRSYYVKRSKYVSEYLECHQLESLVNILLPFLDKKEMSWAIFPTNDMIAEYLDRNFDKLEYFIVPNACGKLHNFLDKEKMNSLAKFSGVLVPCEKKISLTEEVTSSMEGWEFYPCIIKPNISMEGSKSDITVADNINELREKVSWFKNKGYQELLIQEYLDGYGKQTLEVMGYSIKGEMRYQSPPIVKMREYPTYNGSTSYAEFSTGKIIENYIQSIKAMVRLTHYTGLFDLEFIMIKNRVYFIEMNFRNGAPAYALTNSGINVPELWYSEMQKETPIIVKTIAKGRLMAEHLDIRHVKHKELTLRKWIKEFYSCEHKLLFNRKDMKPVVYFGIGKILRKI